ncbi:MAG: tetratricopeptide repeat protein, partial [Pirellulales bacterium]|nr:tetratricopeptide repeat protein [Pirellulales bacterium]
WGWALIAVLAAYLAYGSKEMSAGLPLIVLLYDRVFIHQSWRLPKSRRKWYVLLVLPLVAGAILIVPRLSGSSQSTIGFGLDDITPWAYFSNQPFVLVQYVRLALLPLGQALDYGWLPSHHPLTQTMGMAGWACLAVLVILLWRRSPPLATAVLAALIVLAPTSTLLPFQDIIFEHRFYLPLAFLVSGVWCAVAVRLCRRRPTAEQLTSRLLIPAVLLAIPLSGLTVIRNADYSSALRIHQVDARRHPDNPRVWYAISEQQTFKRPEPKIELMRRAIELSEQRGYFYAGTDYKWRHDLADTLFVLGQASLARPYYEEALRHTYNKLQHTETVFRLAMVASMEGRNEDAERLFQEALAGHQQVRDHVEQVYQEHRRRLQAGSAHEPSASP